MNKRKFLTRGLIALVVLGIALTAYFLVPKSSANTIARTTTRTITVSGKVTDIAQVPIAGAHIAVELNSGKTVFYAYSGSNGMYTLNLTTNPSDPNQKIILGHAFSPGRIINENQSTLTTSNSVTLNFTLAKLPQDIPSTKVLDPVSARCRIKSSTQDYDSFEHLGDYTGKVVNGELFCTADNPRVFTVYATQINAVSKQFNALSVRTGINYLPPVYLTGVISWSPGTAAYTSPGREMVVDINFLSNLTVMTHEYGHLVDWYKGWDESTLGSFCRSNNDDTISHCNASDDASFLNAYKITAYSIFTGYASTSYRELFAEIFAAQEVQNSVGSSVFPDRENMKSKLTNALTLAGTFPFQSQHQISAIQLPHPLDICAAKYIYKFVAAKSNLDQFFSGNLGDWNLDDVRSCKYLSPATTSILTTMPATFISARALNLNGKSSFVAYGRSFRVGIDNSNGACGSVGSQFGVLSDSGSGDFSAVLGVLGKLSPATNYCVKAVSVSTADGSWVSFKTLSEAPSITYAGTVPEPNVATNTRVNVPISITNNSTHSNVVDLVVNPPTGWTITGYSDKTYFRSPGLSFRSILVDSGKTVVTSVTFTSSVVPMPTAKVYIKAEMYPDPTGKLAAAYQPVYVVNGSGSNSGTTACTNTAPTISASQASLPVKSSDRTTTITNTYTITSPSTTPLTDCATQPLNLSAAFDQSLNTFPSTLTPSSIHLTAGNVSGDSSIPVSLPRRGSLTVTATVTLTNTAITVSLPASLSPLNLIVSKCGT